MSYEFVNFHIQGKKVFEFVPHNDNSLLKNCFLLFGLKSLFLMTEGRPILISTTNLFFSNIFFEYFFLLLLFSLLRS